MGDTPSGRDHEHGRTHGHDHRPELVPEPEPTPDHTTEYAGDPEVLVTHGTPGLAERWALLPTRTRHAVTAAVTLAVVAAGSLFALDQRPVPEQAPPVPYPAEMTSITLREISFDEDTDRGLTLSLRASTTGDAPVTVTRVGTGRGGVDLHVDPSPPFVLTGPKPRVLTVRTTVETCEGLPLDAAVPSIQVTLRNARAEQKSTVIVDERYARALSHQLRSLCGLPSAR
ncbi:hypothetical protein [Streptomyces sp. Z26]|uniref:hypothetical protein n=1 Tax=Streptomyces sp. Z26 TaxID=2500177 RepID=UPI000EF137DE|nr:hypothetical protein [Streptomyces sp. Z26]RLL66316.1 hypothetical protein D7M15_04810 [Streptomyces sp. Z26]